MSYSKRTPFEDRHPYSPRHPRPSEIQSHPQGIEHIAPRKSSTASTISRLFSLSRHRQVAPIAQTSTLTLSKSSEARPGNATAVSASRKARSGRIDDSGGHRLLVTGSALPFDDADHRQVVKIKRHTTLLGQRLTLSRDSLDPPNPSRLPLPTSSVCDDALAGMNAVQDKRIYSSSFRQPYASPVDYSLRLKLSRNQIASFRKVSAGYPSRPDLLRRSPLPILRKRKLASSRPKQALRYATDSPDLPTAPRSFTPTSNSGPSTPSPTCKLDSRPRSLEIESPFPSTPQVIRRFVLQDTTALDLLHTSPSCKSCAVPRPDTNRSKNSRMVNEIQSAVISPQLRLLCDRPLPRIPSVERPSIRRKSAPSLSTEPSRDGISGASSDALPDERIDSAIKGLDNIYVNGNKVRTPCAGVTPADLSC